MKLVRFGPAGRERPGALDAQGNIRDLSTVIADLAPAAFSPGWLAQLAALDLASLPLAPTGARIGACVGHIPKVVGVGMNYHDHVEQAGLPPPKAPVLFIKPNTTICGPDDDIIVPHGSEQADWEVEVGVVIGTLARNVPVEQAMRHVAGYCVANDITERAWAKQAGQLLNGKSADTFTPIGPWLVTADEIADPQNLDLFLDLNGQRYQTGNTGQMIVKIDALISHISQFMTLLPGDIVLSGTPAGVGLRSSPQRFLRAGDRLRLGVAGLGEQRATVVDRERAGQHNPLQDQTLEP